MEETFYLRATRNSVIADGIFKRIRAPASDGKSLDGGFQSTVRSALQEAKEAGIEHPIAVGAIPFDPTHESAVYIPNSYVIQPNAAPPARRGESAPVVAERKQLPEHEEYTSMVSEAVKEIRNGALGKVVLSRLDVVHTREVLDSGDILARLIEQNPKAFNFHVPLPEKSAFLVGSSPELLVAKHGDLFYSKPLAGSAARDPSRDPLKEREIVDQLLASAKDKHEHKVVVDSMRETLAPVSTELNIPTLPECISTSKLWHLATTINGRINDPQQNALSLACLLHPTPALSGFPHQTASTLIKQLEPFDREYFGGIVGYCDSNGDGEWFIIIRSGKVVRDKITLFAGAGIVGDSNPESEWLETETKIGTMLHVFDLA